MELRELRRTSTLVQLPRASLFTFTTWSRGTIQERLQKRFVEIIHHIERRSRSFLNFQNYTGSEEFELDFRFFRHIVKRGQLS